MKTKIYKDKVQTSIKTKQLWICQSSEKGNVQVRSLPTLMAILKNWNFFLYAHRTEIYLKFNWSAVKNPQWSAAICVDSLYLPSPKWLSKSSHVPISTIHSRQRWELPTFYQLSCWSCSVNWWSCICRVKRWWWQMWWVQMCFICKTKNCKCWSAKTHAIS